MSSFEEEIDSIAKELATNVERAHANMKPGSPVSVAANVVLFNGLQRLLPPMLKRTLSDLALDLDDNDPQVILDRLEEWMGCA